MKMSWWAVVSEFIYLYSYLAQLKSVLLVLIFHLTMFLEIQLEPGYKSLILKTVADNVYGKIIILIGNFS